jgi:5-methylcytosine-specific restriction endonuclease McrA
MADNKIGGRPWARLRWQVLVRDGFVCQWCGWVDETGRTLHADHRLARDRGGDNSLGNLWCLCRVCNLRKGNRPLPRPRPAGTVHREPRVDRCGGVHLLRPREGGGVECAVCGSTWSREW